MNCIGVIKKIWNKVVSRIDKQDEKYGEYFTFIIVFTTAIFLRFFVVTIAANFAYKDVSTFIAYIFQDFVIFLVSFLSIWIVLAYILRKKPKKIKYLIILATPMVILPPIIDFIDTGGGGYWSFYIIESLNGLYPIFTTFFGSLPIAIKYFGTKIMVLVAISLIGIYVGIEMFKKNRSIYKAGFLALLSTFVVYIIFFFYASFPSWFSFLIFFILDGKSIASVTSANISSLFITPHPIFNTNSFDLRNALLGKLNMIYPIMIMSLLIWKEKIDGNITDFYIKLNKIKENFSEKILNIVLILYTPLLFIFLSYYNNSPYQNLVFSLIYLLCVFLLFSLFGIFFSINSNKAKQIIGICITMLIFVVGHKVAFLFLTLVLGNYSMKLIGITNKVSYIEFSSIITAFVFSIIFAPNQILNAFSWELLLYTTSIIALINILKKRTCKKEILTKDRIVGLILGLSMIIMLIFLNLYILTEILVILFVFLAIIVFFIERKLLYYKMLNYFIILYLIFSLISALVLADI